MKSLKLRLLVVSIFSLSVFSCTGQQSTAESFKDIGVDEASKMMHEKKNMLVLDVRTTGEVAEGKIEGATVIDFQGATFNSIIDQLDKEHPVLVYCAVGGRSGKTMKLMKEKGFKEVYNLSGGMNAWTAAGKPVVK